MRGHRDEVGFELVQPHRLLVELGALDRNGDTGGDELEQLDVIGGELPVDERADVEDADRLVPDEERDAAERADALLAQDRVEDVGMGEVIEDDRPLLGGDPAGEASAERDADAALDLFLDPDRRTRYKLVRVLVPQEDRARVGPQDRADARQEHAEQIIERKVGERGVGDGLDVLEPLARPSLGLEGAGVVDRQGGAVGGELQQLDFVVREFPMVERADVQYADRFAADQQRHAEQRLDALLAEDRIEHLCVVDIVEHDGSALRRHAAGEAAAERDADAALHLLLDPDGRAGDKFVRVCVQQQHRARVNVEELARPQEERGEQLFKVEMRERGIRQCLEPAKALSVLIPARQECADRLASAASGSRTRRSQSSLDLSPFVSSLPVAQPATSEPADGRPARQPSTGYRAAENDPCLKWVNLGRSDEPSAARASPHSLPPRLVCRRVHAVHNAES